MDALDELIKTNPALAIMMTNAVKEAEANNRLIYLYFRDGEYIISPRYLEDQKWIFKAYPGGRKVLAEGVC